MKKWQIQNLKWFNFWIDDLSEYMHLWNFYNLYRWNSDLRRIIDEKTKNISKNWYNFINSNWEKTIDFSNQLIYNKNETLQEFITRIIQELDIFWNCFIEKIKNHNWQVVSFDILDARTMTIMWTTNWDVIWYKQTIWTNIIEFWSDDIIHIKDNVDLDNPFFWISKMESILAEILWDKEASKSNYSFFKNNGIPSQLIILEDEQKDDSEIWEDEDDTYIDEVQLLTNELQKSFSGWNNAHKFLIANKIKDIKQVWTSNKDMEYLEYRKFTTERLCALMGVPKIVLNYSDWINYNNSKDQFYQFYDWTILPLQRKIEWIINLLLNSLWYEGYSFIFIKNSKTDQEKIDFITKWINNWLFTLNEWRKLLDLEEFDDENANKLVINKNLILLDDIDTNSINPTTNKNNNE